jgi:hypothetical protein
MRPCRRFLATVVACKPQGDTVGPESVLAAEHGISRPTLRKRLDEGVGRLREGLRRRDVAVSIAILAGWLTEGAAEAAVPAALSQSLAKIGLAGIGRTAPVPAATSTVTIPAAKTLWVALAGSAIVKIVVAVIVCAGLLAGIVLARQRLRPAAEGDAQQVPGPSPQAAGVPIPAGGPPDPAAPRSGIVVVHGQTMKGPTSLSKSCLSSVHIGRLCVPIGRGTGLRSTRLPPD